MRAASPSRALHTMAYLLAFRHFIADDEGVTSIEYALLGGILGLAVAVGATTLGGAVANLYDFVMQALVAAI